MKKITLEMVRWWVGNNNEEALKTIREIANSVYEKEPWTPKILHNDIIKTWKGME